MGVADNHLMRRSSPDGSKRLTRLLMAAVVLVAVVAFTWSERSNDRDCTEGPCPQDGPLILGAAVVAVLVLVYLVAMVALAVKEHRSNLDKADDHADGRGA